MKADAFTVNCATLQQVTFPLWAAVALLTAEYAFLSITFDSAYLSQRGDLWFLAGYLGQIAALVSATAIGTVLVAQAGSLLRELFAVGRRLDSVGLVALGAHAISAGLLYWISARVFSPEPGLLAVWLPIWFGSALASVVFAVAAAVPWQQFATLWRVSWPSLIGGGFIGAGAWMAGQGSILLWWPLGPWTLRAVELSLKAVLDDVVFVPTEALVGSPQFQVIVDPSCSGFEGLGLMTVFVSAYLLLARRQLRFPAALLLLPLGLAASLIANVVRLAALVLVGTWVSPDIAAGGFHARAGWLFFSGLTLLLVVMARRLPFFAREQHALGLGNPAAAYLLPFLALLAASLITGLGAVGFDLWYGVRIAAAIVVLVAFRDRYPDLPFFKSWSWAAVGSGVAAAVIFIALSPRPDAPDIHALQEQWTSLPQWSRTAWLIVRSFGSVLIVPVVEELAFRGYLLRRLIAQEFETVAFAQMSWVALLVSSAAFAAIHTTWLGGLLAGLIFGIVQIRFGSLGHAIVSHMVSNAVVTAVVIVFDDLWLWS